MTALIFKNARVVRSSWLEEDGRRLDCNPYMSGALEARDALQRLSVPKEKLSEVTDRIFHAGREGRLWVDDPKYGVPFLGSSDILAADISTLPLIAKRQVERNPLFTLGEHWTLITRSGTIGRMAYVRPDMAGMACSEHVLRVVPDPARIPPGFLYAFLSSRYGVPLVVSGTYGAIIQHIEPGHISDIEIPRFGPLLEMEIDGAIQRSAELRSEFQKGIDLATQQLLKYAGVEDCPPHKWNKLPSDAGFVEAKISVARTMRAANYSPRVKGLLGQIVKAGSIPLGQICEGGQLSTGARFKRIDCEPSEGVRLVGQKQGFWMQPEGRWITPRYAPAGIFAEDESVLIASSGTLGDNEVYCRPILVTGRWLEFAYTQHFLRVVSGDPSFSGAFLFAYLRSEIAFRALRSMSTGSKQQEIHGELVAKLPVPVLTDTQRSEIEMLVRSAFSARDKADTLEADALRKLEEKIAGES
ncbi:methylation-associated defense system restriction endonuclease subunit S MAD5 [Burkholderia sp. MSMB1835]|uniref:methylation-associated defense system restriction endonuclease subunit S MAD5 n=1 Tax=Burkholderia sp. MSMB1835 TaxID=1637876 RepID=UPI000AEAD25E|nr:restriction endonuclease subunit S [Burkholderia sp. MSMB1835]